MSKVIKISKGLKIRLKGEADKALFMGAITKRFAIKPTDFLYFTPKLLVKEGDVVLAGDPLIFNKTDERIKITAPVSGTIKAIVRGEKRVIEEIVIEADENIKYKDFGAANPKDLSKEQIVQKLLDSGLWSFIRQRPFSCIANPDDMPKAIHISCYDSSPLAPDNDFIVHGKAEAFQIGIDAIAKLTPNKVHLNIHENENLSKVFLNSKSVQINKFKGIHPVGNIGVQIHHIDPINKGEVVWYLYPQDVLAIGRLFLEGHFNASKIVALTGSEVKNPRYYKTYIGSAIDFMVQNNVSEGNLRYISGNVLTGKKISAAGFVGYYDTQVTVIPEGVEPEFLGWISPGIKKLSNSWTFLSRFFPPKHFVPNTRLNGGERAFVMTGQYEKVFPMDIYPVHLLKAILAEDIDLMEKLGIYEVDAEDFSLCEFVCTSKIESQNIVRKGLDLVRKECS